MRAWEKPEKSGCDQRAKKLGAEGKPSAERRLALALGSNRKLWPSRLRLAAKERTLEGQSLPRSDPGKAVEDGGAEHPR